MTSFTNAVICARIESCASGGGRTDAGILQHADRIWASDSNDPRDRVDIQRTTELVVPPVDHLRLEPQAELHAQPVHMPGERVEAIGPDLGVDDPAPEVVPCREDISYRTQYVLDLANPDAYRHVRGQMADLISELGIPRPPSRPGRRAR